MNRGRRLLPGDLQVIAPGDLQGTLPGNFQRIALKPQDIPSRGWTTSSIVMRRTLFLLLLLPLRKTLSLFAGCDTVCHFRQGLQQTRYLEHLHQHLAMRPGQHQQ